MLTIIIVILLFASLVLVHEWGHFIAARRNGVGVEEFGFGFPPKLFGRVHKGVLYSINLLPLGGFVRMKGEDAADKGPGSFGGASFGVKTKILLAGVGMNLLSAIVLLYVLGVSGLPGLGAPFEPSFLKSTYAQPRQLLITNLDPKSPLAAAGLKTGDRLLAAGGQTLASETDLLNFTKAHAGQAVVMRVHQAAGDRTVSVKLLNPPASGVLIKDVKAGTPAAKAGLKVGDQVTRLNNQPLYGSAQLQAFTAAHTGQAVTLHIKQGSAERDLKVQLGGADATKGTLGVATEPVAKVSAGDPFSGVQSQVVYKLRYDPLTALLAAIYITGALFVATIVGVIQLVASIPALVVGLFAAGVPDQAQAASGPIGIVFILKSISSLGFSYVLLFMANISVALAAFNVLPLPALDGGRLAVAAVQRYAKKSWSAEAEARYHAVGFIALIGLMVLISVYDLRKHF